MRRLAAAALSLLASAAVLYASAAPAAACRCAPITGTEEVREAMESYDLVLEGEIASARDDAAAPHIRIRPQVVYAGDVSGKIELDQTWEQAASYADSDASSILGGDCSYLLIGDPGDRYLLFLRAVADGRYSPGGCASFALGDIEEPPNEALQQRYDAIKLVSGGGTVVDVPAGEGSGAEPAATPEPATGAEGHEAPPQEAADEEHTEGTPWEVILPLAFGIPAAVLIIPALLRRR